MITTLYEVEEMAYKALENLANAYDDAGWEEFATSVDNLQDALWDLIKEANSND